MKESNAKVSDFNAKVSDFNAKVSDFNKNTDAGAAIFRSNEQNKHDNLIGPHQLYETWGTVQ